MLSSSISQLLELEKLNTIVSYPVLGSLFFVSLFVVVVF
jgi:hypothetical protein